jgi:hypothetical protein
MCAHIFAALCPFFSVSSGSRLIQDSASPLGRATLHEQLSVEEDDNSRQLPHLKYVLVRPTPDCHRGGFETSMVESPRLGLYAR